MNTSRQAKQKHKKAKRNDWVCEMCHNYNYSFRVQCNRCNALPCQPYDLLKFRTICKNMLSSHLDQPETGYEIGSVHNFPSFVFVSVALPEQNAGEDYLTGDQFWDTINDKWINQIIE